MLMVNYFLSFLIVLLLLTISWTDLTKRVINNKAVIALFFLIVPFSYFFYGNIFVLNGIVALIVGFVLFQFGIFGGGDVKLLSVLLLAVPTEQIIPLLFFKPFLLCAFKASPVKRKANRKPITSLFIRLHFYIANVMPA